MRKSLKFMSAVTAFAVAGSTFAGLALTASAEVGDVLMSQDFSTTDWGQPSRTDKASGEYIAVDTLPDVAKTNIPSEVADNLLHFATSEGQNVDVTYTMSPTLSKTADVYNVTFDIYLRNASLMSDGTFVTDDDRLNYSYTCGFGDSNAMFNFKVDGDKVSYVSNAESIDTGIQTGEDGVWVKANLKCDTTTHKVNGTLTPSTGDVYTISSSDFTATSAVSISTWLVSSIRFDGNHKGHVDNYLDNFTVTEAAADTYADVTINYLDEQNNVIQDSKTDSAIVGSEYTVPASYIKNIDPGTDSDIYYSYTSGADPVTVDEAGNTINLVFTTTDKLQYTITAQDENQNSIYTIKSGAIIPGTEVTYYADYTLINDGTSYALTDDQKQVLLPSQETKDFFVNYKAVSGKTLTYDYENMTAEDPTGFTVNGHMSTNVTTEEPVDSAVNGLQALEVVPSEASTSAYAVGSLNVSPYTLNYNTVYVSFDSYLSAGGRMTLNLLDSDVTGYSSTGLFSIGTKDKDGYRVNDIQAKGGDMWTRTSVKIDFANAKLYYTVTNSLTGALVSTGSKDITAETLQTITLISWNKADQPNAYIDNIQVVSTDKIVPAAEYTFEDGTVDAFANNGHASVTASSEAEIIDAANNGTYVAQFDSDAVTGTSKQAVSTIDISAATKGATQVTVNYDSYVDSNNVYFGIASGDVAKSDDSNILFSHGYSSRSGYYVINGASGSDYTAANAKWVHTKLVYNCDTGVLSYALTSTDGATTYKTGTSTLTATEVSKIFVTSWAESSIGYIDNITVNVKNSAAIDFEDEQTVLTNNDHAALSVVDGTDADTTKVLYVASDAGAGESTPAIASYDISAASAGKATVIISYDSFVPTSGRATVGLTDVLKSGIGKDNYYVINGDSTSSLSTGEWNHTLIEVDKNAGTYKYIITSLADPTKTKSGSGVLASTDLTSIDVKITTPDTSAMLDNLIVTALGTEHYEPWLQYTATFDATGVMTAISAPVVVVDPTELSTTENEDGTTTKVFCWQAMTPYIVPVEE